MKYALDSFSNLARSTLIKEMNPSITDLKINIWLGLALIFFTSIGRYQNEFMRVDVLYHPVVDALISINWIIVSAVMAAFFIRYIFMKGVLPLGLDTPFTFIALFHFYIALKMLFSDNEAGWRYFAAGLMVVGCHSLFKKIFSVPQAMTFFTKGIFMVIVIWFLLVAFSYWYGGIDSILWIDRYFFFSSHQNHSGATWAFSALSLFFLFLTDQTKKRWLLLAMSIFATGLLVATGSRGSMLGFGVGLFVILFGTKKASHTSLIVLTLIALGSLIYFADDIFQFAAGQIGRGNTRAGTYALAWEQFVENPLFGAPLLHGRVIYVENTILGFMQAGGMVGLIFALLFYAGTFKSIYTAFQKGLVGYYDPYFAGLLCMAVSMSMFEAFPLNIMVTGCIVYIIALSYFSNRA